MNISHEIRRHSGELMRALRNNHYEVTDNGLILLPKMGVYMGGLFSHACNSKDWRDDPNLLPTQGLTDAVGVWLAGVAQSDPWYIAPFSGNVTVAASWTAQNFTANATEFTGYDEATRVEFDEATPAAGAVNNTAIPATFTMTAGSNNIWGVGLLNASPKSDVTAGKILAAATKFAAVRSLPTAGDELNIKYTLTFTSL